MIGDHGRVVAVGGEEDAIELAQVHLAAAGDREREDDASATARALVGVLRSAKRERAHALPFAPLAFEVELVEEDLHDDCGDGANLGPACARLPAS